MEITQHLAAIVKRFLEFLRRWQPLELLLDWIFGWFERWPEKELDHLATVTAGISWPPGILGSPTFSQPERTQSPSTPPAAFEMRFMKLQTQGRFEEMWEMVADDAQRAWGGRDAFVREMPRLGDDMELLDMQPVSVSILDGWTDQVHQRTYSNVARMVMRYRVRQRWREWTFDRQVHLVPAAGGWRTLCYPVRATASGAAGSR